MYKITYILTTTERSSEEKDGQNYDTMCVTAARPTGKTVGTYKLKRKAGGCWRLAEEQGMPFDRLPSPDYDAHGNIAADQITDPLWERGSSVAEKSAPNACADLTEEEFDAALSALESTDDSDEAVRNACRNLRNDYSLRDAVNVAVAIISVFPEQHELEIFENQEEETFSITISGILAEAAMDLLDSITPKRPFWSEGNCEEETFQRQYGQDEYEDDEEYEDEYEEDDE